MVPYTMTSSNMKNPHVFPPMKNRQPLAGNLIVNPFTNKICGKHKFHILIGPTSDILLGMADSIIWLPTS